MPTPDMDEETARLQSLNEQVWPKGTEVTILSHHLGRWVTGRTVSPIRGGKCTVTYAHENQIYRKHLRPGAYSISPLAKGTHVHTEATQEATQVHAALGAMPLNPSSKFAVISAHGFTNFEKSENSSQDDRRDYDRPKKAMEDRHTIIDPWGTHEDMAFLGVYDGHGPPHDGSVAAEYCRNTLHDILLEELGRFEQPSDQDFAKAFTRTFEQVDANLRSMGVSDGTTATVAVLHHPDPHEPAKVHVANVGDSPAVLFGGTTENPVAFRVSVDHSAADELERMRVSSVGGALGKNGDNTDYVAVLPHGCTLVHRLQVTRSLGDFIFKDPAMYSSPVIPSPHVYCHHLEGWEVGLMMMSNCVCPTGLGNDEMLVEAVFDELSKNLERDFTAAPNGGRLDIRSAAKLAELEDKNILANNLVWRAYRSRRTTENMTLLVALFHSFRGESAAETASLDDISECDPDYGGTYDVPYVRDALDRIRRYQFAAGPLQNMWSRSVVSNVCPMWELSNLMERLQIQFNYYASGSALQLRTATHPRVDKKIVEKRFLKDTFDSKLNVRSVREVYDTDDWKCELMASAKAAEVITHFNMEMQNSGSTWLVQINLPEILSITVRDELGRNVVAKRLIEPFIEGNFRKYNSNNGWVPPEDTSRNKNAVRDYMQALSHYSWHWSSGDILLCDLQGAFQDNTFVLTCPAIHSTQAGHFGKTDLGIAGQAAFLDTHECSAWCHRRPNGSKRNPPWRSPGNLPMYSSMPKAERTSRSLDVADSCRSLNVATSSHEPLPYTTVWSCKVARVLELAGQTSGKKVELIKNLFRWGKKYKMVLLTLPNVGQLQLDLRVPDLADIGICSKNVKALLDSAGGVGGTGKWMSTLERIDAKITDSQNREEVAELKLLRCFAIVKVLGDSAGYAELDECRACLNNHREAMRGSVIYALADAAFRDLECGLPNLTSLASSLRLLLHGSIDTLAGLSDVAVAYLEKHVSIMTECADSMSNAADVQTPLQTQQAQRQVHAKQSKSLSELESLVGLEKIKNAMADMSARIDLDRERGIEVTKQQMSMRFDGNPGTGKTTVARIYGDFLKEKCVLGREAPFKETSGAKLISDGVDKLRKLVEEELKDGGVLFIDEAYQLNPKTNPFGGSILDYLLPEMENRRGKLVVIIAGYCKPMDELMAFNEGLPSRFPERFVFEDYDEGELLQILQNLLQKDGKWKLADEKHARILARRLARQAGTTGFGNARAVRNAFDLAKKRQAARILVERQRGSPDMFLIERADLLGPKGLDVKGCKALKQLMGMRGLQAVKDSVHALIRLVQANAQLEDLEKQVRDVNLNKVFLGNPGTGKTTVAKLYGEILRDLGMLSKGEVIIKIPQDFTGDQLGQSETKTKAILDNARGCVLVIDEAYGLHPAKNTTDPYKTAIVDTIVAEVQGVPGDDRCVLLLGYQNEMEEMMRNTNPGLARRFNLQDAFRFEDFTGEDLLLILYAKVKKMDMCINLDTARAAVKILEDQKRTELHFGNGGAVDNLLSSAKSRMMTRLKECTPEQITAAEFHVSDFVTDEVGQDVESILSDPNGFIENMFSGLIGCSAAKEQVKKFISTIRFSRRQGRDPLQEIELNFFFGGRPGTGKTTVARIMGRLLKALSLISKADVIECSASDLCTGFVGQAGKQTCEVFKKALGGILFIDEAYRLNPEKGGAYMREALDEMVQILTEREFKGNMAVIIAGYEKDMSMLFKVNPGLKSRIQTTVTFEQFSAKDAEELLRLKLAEKDLEVPFRIHDLCEDLVKAPHWSNGRDVEAVAKCIYQEHAASLDSAIGRRSTQPTGSGSESVVRHETVNKVFAEIIDQKHRANLGSSGQSEVDQTLKQLQELPMFQPSDATSTAVRPAIQQRSKEVVPEAELETVQPQGPPEEVTDHFGSFDPGFLQSIQDELENLGVDVKNLGQVASFDIQQLRQKFPHNFDLVKEWKRKIEAVWEQAKLIEEELAKKKRVMRPRWRCKLCGRSWCKVAPYIEGYDEVEL
eukprot:TRINITY_DN6148_c0_g3_i1.p1 TRINITY_DN6148_c0_g3~~TRINITY_DN6148_c0_g3_i1.p1  ORF type:complete len:2010 (+),score=360.50 TRINITY_DN6148_c0_g3_i1:98-6127(+)